ncbi:hypothetical protein KKC08_05240 [Patescibacteria group bacterium]|nr:hypothetical protein [Patescibacteria group bacterium]
MDFISLFLLFISFVNLVLAFIVYFRNQKNTTNSSFAIFILNASLWPLSIAFFRASTNIPVALFWDRLIYISGTLVPSSFVYFAHILTEKKLPSKNQNLVFAGIPTFIIYLLIFSNFFIQKINPRPHGPVVSLGPIYPFWILYFCIFFAWAVIKLVKKFLNSRGFQKAQLRLILLSVFFPLIGALPFNIFLPLFGNYKYIHIGPIFITFMIAIISYAIIKHRLLDIRLIFVKLLIYFLLLTILAGLYAGTFSILGNFLMVNMTSKQEFILSTFLSLIMAFSFQPLRSYLEKNTDEIFYKKRYHPEKLLKNMGKLMSSTILLKDLNQFFLQKLTEEMKISYGAIFLKNKNLSKKLSLHTYPDNINLNEKSILTLYKSPKNVIVLEELDETSSKKAMYQTQTAFSISLKIENKKIGLLLLGEKSSGDIYSSQDIEILEILASQMAVAIQNSLAYYEIQQFSETLRGEIDKATLKLKKANLRLKELSSLKDEFVSIASHELRTPMTAIKSYLWLALNKHKKELSQKLTTNLNRAYISTERTITLVKDMLTISRIEGRRLDLNFVKLDLALLAKQVFDELKIKADEKQIKFSFEKPEFKSFTRADEHKITEVLQNIISNAIKFTPPKGSVQIFFQDKNGKIETSIKDTGPGIPKRSMPNLFKKFGRLGGSFAKLAETPGTGLGLYIAKQIIGLHKGRIWVQSKVGEGSTFIFSLPKYND